MHAPMKNLPKVIRPKKEKVKERSVKILKREELEKKAVEGAKKAVQEYRHVFERLAEYDRA